MFASLDDAETLLAPLEAVVAGRARALLQRGATVLVPNPAARYLHLTGNDPGRIGLRVSALAPALAGAIAAVGAILATSANLHGGPDPRGKGQIDQVAGRPTSRARPASLRGSVHEPER